MLYLLDANVLITASNQYYPINRFPEYWEWILYQGQAGRIKIPWKIMNEILAGQTKKDKLKEWLRENQNKHTLLLDEEVDERAVRETVSNGYADKLASEQIASLGRDPFLIAYCLADRGHRRIVATEVSKPGKQPHNRHIPDACKLLNVGCYNPF